MYSANRAAEQAHNNTHPQPAMAMGPAIEALWGLKGDEAKQAQVFWIAAGMVLEMPGLTMGEKFLLIALYRRVDFARGLVDDTNGWLAKWLGISKRAVQAYRSSLHAKGITMQHLTVDQRGLDDRLETAFPMLARLALEPATQNLHRSDANSATKESILSSDREETIRHATRILGLGSPGCIVNALAYRVAAAHGKGKEVGSIAFIAQRLSRLCDEGDDTWIYDLPFRIPQNRQDRAVQLANKALAAMDKANIGADRRAMLATVGIEDMDARIEYYGHNFVDDGIAKEVAAGAPQLREGYSIAGWSWFDDAIKAARNEAIAAQRRPPTPRQSTKAEREAQYARAREAAAARSRKVREAAKAAIVQIKAAGIEADERELMYASQQMHLGNYFGRDVDIAAVLPKAVARWLAAPTRQNIKAWSNMGDAIRATVVESRAAAYAGRAEQQEAG